jgi:hypothetical protein
MMGPPPTTPLPKPPLSIEDVKEAWVLVFEQGTKDEDICVDRTQRGRAPSLLAFEDTRDAEHFARILQADGADTLATAVCWEARQLTSFSDESGLKVMIMPRGELPAPTPPGWSPESPSPGMDGPAHPYPAPDNYAPDKHLPDLEDLFTLTPDECSDDDCSVPEAAEPYAPLGSDALRQAAMAAVDAMLAMGDSKMDLPTLMKRAWESVKNDTPEK